MKLHLVDGTYELFRNHYGVPPRSATDGSPAGAAWGLLRTLVFLLRQDDVTHVACAFDHVIESFRNDLFDGYKTGEGIDPELYAQFPLAERVARALGVVVWPMVEFEADDALATAAHRWKNARSVGQVLLCSPDKDLAQCISGDRVVCWDRRRDRILDEEGVIRKFGVPPASIPDWLALVGDTADGIPGIPGWGEKSAATVLGRYGRIDGIPADPGRWEVRVRGAERLATYLREHRDEALLYKRLAILRTDVPLPERLQDLRWQGALRKELEPLCVHLGDRAILDRIPRWRD